MIKKSSIEDELFQNMSNNLSNSEEKRNAEKELGTAIENIHSAMQILDDLNLTKHSDSLLNVLVKIANSNEQSVIDEMEENEDMFNFADDGINDLLAEDLENPDYLNNAFSRNEPQVFEDVDFEDE